MRLKFFHIPKPRRFNYQPVYYDEAKERRIERERRIREELGMSLPGEDQNRSAEQRIRGKFSSYRANTKDIEFTRRAKRTSNTRIVVLVVLIFTIMFYMGGFRLERLFSIFFN
ncbi:MAG: hypothetical protein FWH18_03185 [Marinilabiliaceae bacterium]|nr:hypothetical protein [Marinilabiliaceae bacterium]